MLSLSLSIPALAARGNRSGRALAPRFPGLAALYDPLDRGSLFRDVAMGSPVTADGQAVAAVRDQSGNGRHLLQPGSAARPAYRTDGALHWLEGDGVDDMLSGPVPVTGYPFTLAVAFELDGAGSGIMGFHEAANAYKALLVNGYLRAMDRTATVTQQAGKTDSGLPTRCVAVAGYTSTSVRLVTSEYATEKVGYSQSFGAPSDLRLFSFRDADPGRLPRLCRRRDLSDADSQRRRRGSALAGGPGWPFGLSRGRPGGRVQLQFPSIGTTLWP